MSNLDEAQALVGFGVWECEGTSEAVTCTAALRDIYGELPTTRAALVAAVHADDRAQFAAALALHAPFELEHRLSHESRVVQTRARLFGTRLVAAAVDITAHHARMGELVFADRMASVATLAGGLAHEINNPLAFIAFNLETVHQELRAPRGTDRWRELDAMLDEARAGVQRIQKIVRGISLFARKSEDHHTLLALDRVLEHSVDATGTELRHRAKLVRDYAPAPAVRANETRLVQVFVNLLQNAAAAIPEGHADRHEIRIATRGEGGRAIIEISDTGHGMPPGEQARIFDPFYTTKAIGSGTGLGLSICYGIVRSLGGEITVHSALGAGTMFRIALPGESQGPTIATPKVPQNAAPPRRGKVLIVDDEVVFATSLRRLIARDHEAIVMNRGRDVLDQIRAGVRYDAILCDLMMPELTGMELHAQLLELAPDQADRMIFVTGGAFTETAQRFLERLRTPWFEKPCHIGDLRAAVAALIR